MTKSRIILLSFILLSTIALYMLPRYVVNNNAADKVDEEAPATSQSSARPIEHSNVIVIPDSVLVKIDELYDSFINAENQEKRLIFADSLANAYKSVGKLDSLAKYLEIKAIENPSSENFLIAGDGYYEAFNFAVDQTRRNYLAAKAQDYYKRVLDENSSLLDVKSKLAMTYVAGSNPMQGITMLREVLADDSSNQLAIYNLGVLSITSGQFEKAIEHFERLKELDPENPEAHFYIGYCFFELGKVDEAKPYFEKVLDLGISGGLVDASKDYLKRINK